MSLARALLGLFLLVACNEESTVAAPSRVVAVAASESAGESTESFCDVHGDRAFSFPAGVESAAQGWRWVNVWASWCRPCVEEMPRLLDFRQRLADEGIEVTTVFLNADNDDEDYASFVEEHPFAEGPRVTSVAAIQAWMGERGLDAAAPLPAHFFVRPDGTLACARSAAIGEDDFASVRRLLRDE